MDSLVMVALSEHEIKTRAGQIKLVLTDNDGVLTDTGVYYSERGEELKRFSIRDGMGVERLKNDGIETAIITGELSGSVKKRSEKLKMRLTYLGVKDKLALLSQIMSESGYEKHEMAFIGDDVNDLAIIEELNKYGLTASPADAMPVIQERVHYIASAKGGNGAFRDFAEWILNHRNGGKNV